MYYMKKPDKKGHFGKFGGRYVPETLIPALEALEAEYRRAKGNNKFKRELNDYLINYAGRPTPLFFAGRFSQYVGMRVYLKREDLCHTGAHKINNTIGQALLARQMNKPRVIAETGAGQHGVAVATAASLLDLECVIYMGSEDIKRQSLNVIRMRLLGAEVVPVNAGSCTLKDAMNEAIRDWVTNVENTHYIIGSVAGPHPYPMMVRDFQSIIGKEARRQVLKHEGKLPDILIACIGGGSNAMGLFSPFLKDKKVMMTGVEAGGFGLKSGKHGASLTAGRRGVLHGSMSYVLQTADGQIQPAHSISAGLDYPGVGPELSYLKDAGRINILTVTDREALDGFKLLSEKEGIIPALESAHAIAGLNKVSKTFKGKVVILNLSGRGDKDVSVVAKSLGIDG